MTGPQLRASVIVPTFGQRPEYLREAVAAIVAQLAPPFSYEILIVDNSPDGSARPIVDTCSPGGRPIRYIREKRLGLHHARHAGAQAATGEILVYIDDDVVPEPQWLEGLLKPFEDVGVACAGGKTLPKWEGERPVWFAQFEAGYLSLLDLGESTLELRYPVCVWGCNMAVRRDVLYAVGGFNPDGLGDSRQIWLRGDGECGLQRKIFESGKRVVYTPDAILYHRIPSTRLTSDYFYRRSFAQGIQDSYERVRYLWPQRSAWLEMAWYIPYCFARSARHYIASLRHPNQRVMLKARAWLWYGKGQHHLRTALSPKLRRHVLRDTYLTR